MICVLVESGALMSEVISPQMPDAGVDSVVAAIEVAVEDANEVEVIGEEVAVVEGLVEPVEAEALVPVEETAVCVWLQPTLRPISPAAETSSRSRRRTTRFYHALLRFQRPC